MPSSFTVRAARSVEACRPLAGAIDELNRRSPRPTPFGTFAFLENFVANDEFGAGRELLLLTAHEGERLVGFLPLCRVEDRWLGRRVRRVELMLSRDADRPGVLADSRDQAAVADAFWLWLAEHGDEWDVVDLVDQDGESSLRRPPPQIADSHFVRLFETPPCASIRLRWRSMEEYQQAIGRKFRQNLARGVRRLLGAGDVELTVGETPEAAQALLEVYTRIERRSWKSLVHGTIGRHPKRRAFFEGLCSADQQMRLQVSILSVDRCPIAGSINGGWGRTFYALQMCFDEALASLSPGQLLLFMTVRAAVEGGYASLGLLHGSTYYKTRWLAEPQPTHSVQVFRRGSLPLVKAKLGDLRRSALRSLPEPAEEGFNPEKRGLPADAAARLAVVDIAPTCAAHEDVLASGVPLVRWSSAALATLLPFRVDPPAATPAQRRRAIVRRVESREPVAIFDADSPPALAFTRSLGRAGIPVQVYAPDRLSVAGWSRFATGVRVCPELSDTDRFQPWLERELTAGNIRYIAPTSDQLTYYLAELRHLLPPAVQRVTPERDDLLGLLFKDRFHALCDRIGQETPFSLCPNSREEALDLAERMPYPVILKPRAHVGVGVARGVVVRDPAGLRAAYGPYAITPQNRLVLERFPGLRWPMLQEYVPEALTNLYSVSGILGPDGEVLARAATRKTAQWPPKLGIGTLFEGYEEEALLEQGTRAASALVHRGLFELEYIHDRRINRFLAIDLNPRAYGQIALDIARGNDLPLLWYRLASGEPGEPQPSATNHARWVHSIPYHVGNWVGFLTGPDRIQRLDAYLDTFDRDYRRIDVVNDLGDPLPSFVFTAKMLRHPGGLIRPFLKSDL